VQCEAIVRTSLNVYRLPGRKNRRQSTSRTLHRGWLFFALLVCWQPLLSGCQKAEAPPPDLRIATEIAPQPAKVGPATVTLKLADRSGTPRNAARVNLEGNMTHAGMRPVFGEAPEVEPGVYRAPIEFTMAGDWVLTFHITLPDGRKFEHQFEVKAGESG
jgi:hypothetical protein